jgi:hypothetical protein
VWWKTNDTIGRAAVRYTARAGSRGLRAPSTPNFHAGRHWKYWKGIHNHLPWYPGKETRNPPPTMAIGTGMNINVADLDKDGKVDIVVAGKSGLYLFENRGLPPTKRMQ